QQVEAFAEQALELDPMNSHARSLRSHAHDRKRQAVVEQCASQARRFQATGDLDAAIAEVHTGLTAYPSDARLTAIPDSRSRDLARTGGRAETPAAGDATVLHAPPTLVSPAAAPDPSSTRATSPEPVRAATLVTLPETPDRAATLVNLPPTREIP